MKFRKTIFSARIFDLFDVGIMARVRERLALMKLNAKKLDVMEDQMDRVRFRARIVARRKDNQGKSEIMVLQRWTPENM